MYVVYILRTYTLYILVLYTALYIKIMEALPVFFGITRINDIFQKQNLRESTEKNLLSMAGCGVRGDTNESTATSHGEVPGTGPCDKDCFHLRLEDWESLLGSCELPEKKRFEACTLLR